jgi:hypothetical protein
MLLKEIYSSLYNADACTCYCEIDDETRIYSGVLNWLECELVCILEGGHMLFCI